MNSHSNMHSTVHTLSGGMPQFFLGLFFILALVFYILAVVHSNKRYQPWPVKRTILWLFGVLFAAASLLGPIAERAHTNITAHMVGHLLLGMLAPLLMALASPMALLLRTLPVAQARNLTRLLKSWPSRMYTHPVIASLLNIGGLWLLYTTPLYSLMHESMWIYVLIHFHIFVAGYLFTVSMIYIDPVSHRTPFLYRAIVLTIALAGHGILSKYIYAHPPVGVPQYQAELGSMIMYYGGDVIDCAIIFMLCLQWYRSTRPRATVSANSTAN